MKKQSKLNTSCIAIFTDGNTRTFTSIEKASESTGLSVSAIKIRCNKSGSKGKDGIQFKWLDEHTRRHFQAKKSRRKGNSYELQIINELSDIGFTGLKSSRSESKNMDNNKVDICDSNNELSCYIQCKNTQSSPNIEKISKECPLKDKPLIICWKKSSSCTKEHEYVLMPKKYFYHLLESERQMIKRK